MSSMCSTQVMQHVGLGTGLNRHHASCKGKYDRTPDHVAGAQGLEFDDVFLTNFFSDSPAAAEWRVLMAYLEELEAQVTVSQCFGLRQSCKLHDAASNSLLADRGHNRAVNATPTIRSTPADSINCKSYGGMPMDDCCCRAVAASRLNVADVRHALLAQSVHPHSM